MTEEEPKTTAVVHHLDFPAAKKRLDEIAKEKVDDLETDVDLLEIKTPDSEQIAVDYDSQIGKLIKAMDAQEDELSGKEREFCNQVRSLKNSFAERLKAIRAKLKGKLREYDNWRELEQKRQQKLIDEANKKLQADLNAHAKESGVAAPVVTSAPLPKQPTTVRTESGASSHQRRRWTFEILSENLVTREYCSADPKKIRAAVDAGLRDKTDAEGNRVGPAIPGVRIFEEITRVTRT